MPDNSFSSSNTDRRLIEMVGVKIKEGVRFPVMVLHEVNGPRIIPVGITLAEASYLAMYKQKVIEHAKPIAHEVLISTLKAFDIELRSVEITAIREGMYCATMTMVKEGTIKSVSIRPSDGYIFSMLSGCPFYCLNGVFNTLDELMDENGDLPVFPENEFSDDNEINHHLAQAIFGNKEQEDDSSDNSDDIFGGEFHSIDEINPDEEPSDDDIPKGPVVMLLPDGEVENRLLKAVLKKLNKRHFGRYKM